MSRQSLQKTVQHGLLLILLAASPCIAQDFALVVPSDPQLTSSARLSGNTLIIVDANGQRHLYERAQQFDSQTGGYHGYFCPQLDKVIRWPAINSGPLQILDTATSQWSTSKMRVKTVGNPNQANYPPSNVSGGLGSGSLGTLHLGNNPGLGGPAQGFGQNPGLGGNGGLNHRRHHLAAMARGNQFLVTRIDAKGQLQISEGVGDFWTQSTLQVIGQQLVPDAPILLLSQSNGPLPVVLTVNARSELIQIVDGRHATVIDRTTFYPAGSKLQSASENGRTYIFAIDSTGRIRQVDLATGISEVIDPSTQHRPGAELCVLQQPSQLTVALVDKAGTLISYERPSLGAPGGAAPAWNGPYQVMNGCVPQSPIAGLIPQAPGSRTSLAVALVDAVGNLHLLERQPTGLAGNIIMQGLMPGSPVTLAETQNGLQITAVDTRGVWVERIQSGLMGIDRQIATGFPVGAHVLMTPLAATGFAVNTQGQLIACHLAHPNWSQHLVIPGQGSLPVQLPLRPLLVSRDFQANPPLPPATVLLTNTHTDDLVVNLVDLADPTKANDQLLSMGATLPVQVERDSGGVLREVYEVPVGGGLVEQQVYEKAIPPAVRYKVAVYSHQTTYKYIDRRKSKSPKALADFDLKSLTSVGRFPLAAGDQLRDGETIDVYRQARQQNNPGALPLLGTP